MNVLFRRTRSICLIIAICFTPSAVNAAEREAYALSAAATTKDEIAKREAQLSRLQERMVANIEQMISSFDITRPGSADEVMRSMRPLVHQLNLTSKQLLANQDAYFDSLRSLHTAVVEAPTKYRAAAAAFERYAQDEPFDDIRKDYLVLAESWSLVASKMERRVSPIRQEGRDIIEFKKYLERTSLFLDRFETHLASFPDTPSGDAEFEMQMRRYVGGVESLRRLLLGFREKVGASSKSQALTSESGVAADLPRRDPLQGIFKPAMPVMVQKDTVARPAVLRTDSADNVNVWGSEFEDVWKD